MSRRETLSKVVSSGVNLVKLLAMSKASFAGFILVLLYIMMAIIGPVLRPVDVMGRPNLIYKPPSWDHPLGTDSQGKDILATIMKGSGEVLYIAFLAALTSVLISAMIGALAGFKGGGVEWTMNGIVDVFLTIPHFPLLVVLAGMVSLDNMTTAILIGLLSWPSLARAIRAQVLSLKEREYIEVATALDLGTKHIIFSEIMPNLMPYIALNFAFSMLYSIFDYGGLVFLGLVPYKSENWGVMINLAWNRGAIYYKDSVFYIMSPIMAIVVFEIALILLSMGFESIFNPRLREK